MRDVFIASVLYSILFVVLTTPVVTPIGGFSVETLKGVHWLISEVIFWLATFYICASATYGAFARQDRFSLSQNYPLLNRVLSVLMVISPFLAIFLNARFVFLMLGLLLFSHIRSKTPDEHQVDFTKSRALSNMLLIPIFTLALMLMSLNGYNVTSILNFNSTNKTVIESADVSR